MTQRSVTYLKARFETGDVPTQSDYQDVFDSFLSLEASSEQTLSGPIVMTSAQAQTFRASSAAITAVSASRVEIQQSCSVAAIWVDQKSVFSSKINVSAGAGTQAAGTKVSADVSLVYGNDVLGFGIVMASAEPGRIQVIVNTNTTVMTVFPASGCNFIGTAENAPIALAKNSTMTIAHVGASAYGVTRGTI